MKKTIFILIMAASIAVAQPDKLFLYLSDSVTDTISQNLMDAGTGDFEISVEGWVAYGTNTVEVSTNKFATGTSSLKISYSNNANGGYRAFWEAGALVKNLEVGKTYYFKVYLASGSGNFRFYVGTTSTGLISSGTMTEYTIVYTATGTSVTCYTGAMGSGEIAYIDNIRVYKKK